MRQQHPVALADAVAQMNRRHANDRVYVTLLDHAAQAELDGQALPGVPLSMANVLEPLKDCAEDAAVGRERGGGGVGGRRSMR